MNVLVLAQTPPPLHGQSVMVQTMLEGLRGTPGLELHHVNFALSHDHADIGRWRFEKMLRVFLFALRAVAGRFRHGCDTLYYVPAPAKRGALYRDWAAMAICRPFFRRVVLHWQAGGLGEWLDAHASPPERILSHLLLGRADLALVLGENLRADARRLNPRRTVVVRNGIADPCPGFTRLERSPDHEFHAIFVGLCSRDKGLWAAAAGVMEANRRTASAGKPPFRLSAAGAFPDSATKGEFEALAAASRGLVRHVGFVTGTEKSSLFANADILVFPTAYMAETQGLVVAEALAFDLPVIVTRWRAVHEGLPASHVQHVEPDQPGQIADALIAARAAGTPRGALRAHFLAHFTKERFIAQLGDALLPLSSPPHG